MLSAETPRGGASVAAIETQIDLMAFVDIHFVPQIHTSYPRRLDSAFKAKPFLAENCHFLKFLARTLLIAAEFGFSEAGGHALMAHLAKVDKDKILDPRLLLYMASFMAQKTVSITEERLQQVDQLRQLNPSDFKEQFNSIFDVNRPHQQNRRQLNLPVFLPDIDQLEQIADINFTKDDLNIDQNRFRNEKLVATKIAFPEIDIESVFFHPLETWQPLNSAF